MKSGLETLPCHRVVARPARVPQRNNDLWHARGRHGLDHFRAGTDNAAALRLGTDHEPRHVLQIDERMPVAVALADELGGLPSRLGIEDRPNPRFPLAAEEPSAVRDQSHRPALDPHVRTQEFR